MASTFFAPANDIGAISRYQLQDEAQRMAADDSRRRYFSELFRANVERERARRDENARLSQTGAYRDVGMRDADVRSQLGLGQIASNEKIAGMPYERMTPFQQKQLEVYEKNPWMMGDPRLGVQQLRNQQDQAELVRIARGAANIANLKLKGAEGTIRDAVAKQLDTYPGLWMGMSGGNAMKAADQLLAGQELDPDQANRPVGKAAKQFFDRAMAQAASAAVTELGDAAAYIQFDPAARRFFSVFDGAEAPPPPPSFQTPFQQPQTNVLPPVVTQPLTSNTPAIPNRAPRRFTFTPGRGLVPTNAPAY